MKPYKKPFISVDDERPCPRVRLSEGPIASVDACGCGVLHLQIGALTLRLAPEAIASLLATLGSATAAYTARYGRPIGDVPPDPSGLGFGTPRGRA
jgi:hypothetical protein